MFRTALLVVGLFAMSLAFTGCNTTSAQEGAVLGGLLGAGTGAVIGNQSGNAGEGALIGGAAGALGGALIGDNVDKRRGRTYQDPPPSNRGHWETRTVRSPSGEWVEQRIWVPDY